MSSDGFDDWPGSRFPEETGALLHFPLSARRSSEYWHPSQRHFDHLTLELGTLSRRYDLTGATMDPSPGNEPDGLCVAIWGHIGAQSRIVGRARLREVATVDPTLFMFGEVVIPDRLRGSGLHEVLVAIRAFVARVCLDIEPTRLLWMPGQYARKAGLGFVELLDTLPYSPFIQRHVIASRDQNPTLLSGVFHYDDSALPRHIALLADIAEHGLSIPPRRTGDTPLTLRFGSALLAYVQYNLPERISLPAMS